MKSGDIHGWLGLARTLANNAGLTIRYEIEHKPRTDGKTIYMGAPAAGWEEEQTLVWAGTMFHEIGHNVPAMSDAFTMAKAEKIDMRSFYGTLLNLVEDYRQEHYQHGRYAGRDTALSFSHGHTLGGLVSQVVQPPKSKEQEILQQLLVWDSVCRADWQPHVYKAALALGAAVDVSHLDKYQGELNALRDGTAWDTKALVDKLLDEAFDDDSEQRQEDGRSDDGAESGNADGSRGETGGSDSPASTQPSEVGRGDTREQRGRAARTKYDALMHDHGESGGASYAPLSIDYTDATTRGAWKVNPQYTVHTRNTHGEPDAHYVRAIAEIGGSGKALANTVKKLLITRTETRKEGGYKRGRLHTRNLHRAKQHREDVFFQRTADLTLDTAVSVVVDMSGSMGGEKYSHAIKACSLLNDALSVCGVPFEIVGFSHLGDASEFFLYKQFNERVKSEDIELAGAQWARHMGNNHDAEALLFAYSRLLRQTAQNRAIIVLSDGSPAARVLGGGCAYSAAKQTIEKIEQEKLATIYGLGIMDNNVEALYKRSRVIHNSGELEGALLSIVKERVL